MTWLLGLTITLLTALLGVNLWILVYQWRALLLLQAIQEALQVYDRPAALVQPLPEPGTAWAPSDAELASHERRLQAESLQRTPPLSATRRSRPTWRQRTG